MKFLERFRDGFRGRLAANETRIEHGASRYVYRPLDAKARTIRLLVLEPAHDYVEALRGRLVHVRLSNCTHYFALSYVSGDPMSIDFVLIGDRKLEITKNLGRALRHVRQAHPDAVVVLWADGICINQDSIIERNHQVGIMGSIYKSAMEVFVWIDENLDTKSPLFQQIMARSKSAKETYAPIWLSDYPNSCLLNVISVFQNPYWGRLWVQGELINAAKLRVFFPNFVMFDSGIRTFVREIMRNVGEMRHQPGKWTNDNKQLKDALVFTVGSKMGIGYYALAEPSGQYWAQDRLTDLMYGIAQLKVTDPRDFVFGLIHIANDYNDGDIKVDYEKSVREVFLLAFHHHVGRHRHLAFLDGIGYDHRHHSRMGMEFPEGSWLRSWFSRLGMEFPEGSWLRSWIEPKIVHSCWTAAFIPCLAEAISCSSNVIHVHGFPLSLLSQVTTMLPEPGQDDCSLTQQITRLFEAMPSLLHSDCLNPEEQVHNLMRILKADSFFEKWGLNVFDNVLSALDFCRTLTNDPARSDVMIRGWDVIGLDVDFPSPATELAFRGILHTFQGRSLVRIDTGQLGLSSCQVLHEGDEVWIIFGCHNPMILRPNGENYLLMGPAYFPDFEDGVLVGGPDIDQEFKAGDDCNGHTVCEITIW